MTAQLLKMDEDVYHLISEIIFNGTTRIRIVLRSIWMMDSRSVHSFQRFAEKMAYYPEITAQLNGYEKGVIDMEVGTFFTPFSKVYGLVEEEEETIDEESE